MKTQSIRFVVTDRWESSKVAGPSPTVPVEPLMQWHALCALGRIDYRRPMTDSEPRHALITGANTGIGRATALELARRGVHVTLACRSRAKTEPVLDEIRSQAPAVAVHFLPLDLASLASVRDAATAFLASDRPLHILVNNAGLAGQRGRTQDGFEIAFGVNHLGHFLLTQLLLDKLREHAPARIINVASQGHYRPRTVAFDSLRQSTASLTGLDEYNVSKLCNVLFTQELARRLAGSGVTTYALHPGVIASDVWRSVPWPIRPVITAFMRSNEEGARTSIYCALDPSVADESGLYYESCATRAASKYATPELAIELWRRSEDWVGTVAGK